MTLKHMRPDQESHNHTEGRSAFSPSPSYSFSPQHSTQSMHKDLHPARREWVLRKVCIHPESWLDWQSIIATSFLGESKNTGCQCRIELDSFHAEQQGILKVQQESGKRRTRKSHSACQLMILQLKYCWRADVSQEEKKKLPKCRMRCSPDEPPFFPRCNLADGLVHK